MGQRANLIIVRNGQFEMFYSHWGANTLPQDLFWALTLRPRSSLIQRQVDKSEWLDDIWAEGGAVLDEDKRVLLFFGGEDLLFDVLLRRVFLELMRKTWQGWQIHWAHEGIADIAAYVGHPGEQVLSRKLEPAEQCHLSPPQEESWTDIVGSVVSTAGLRLFPLAGDVRYYLSCGLLLAEATQSHLGLPTFDFGEHGFPTGGFHLDLNRHRLDFWRAAPDTWLAEQLGDRWPGWQVVNHQDRFECQLELAGSALRIPAPSRAVHLDQLRNTLLYQSTTSPADTLLSVLTKDLPADVVKIEINSYALRDDRFTIPREEKEMILSRIISDLE